VHRVKAGPRDCGARDDPGNAGRRDNADDTRGPNKLEREAHARVQCCTQLG